ncbi:MAG: NAD(P)/FAD-dependent oxidoreductase [bacterium]|nr:NAD(P)/FAD-dependent oxidoreductase [bacterium]
MEKIIIIGAGVAGLSAGIYARLAGFDAEIYESNVIAGGECTGWNRKGYHIDNCIHWLTGTRKDTALYEVWKKVGALTDDTEYADVSTFLSSVSNGKKATLWLDLNRTKKELIVLSPEDREEIESFIRYVEYAKQCMFPAEKPMDMWKIKDYIEMGKTMMDFPKITKELGNISIEEYAKRFKHPLIQKMLCDYLPKENAITSFLVSYATVVNGNGEIPLGGSLQLSLRMEKRFKQLGGKIFYNKPVASIVVKNRKAIGVTFAGGEAVSADYVISTVDTNVLFGRLIDSKYMPRELKVAYGNPKAYPIISAFQVAYSVPLSEPRDATIFTDIKPLTVGKKTVDRMGIKLYGYDKIYIKDGRCVLQTCINQSHEDFAYWKSLSKENYQAEKDRLVMEITKRIEQEFSQFAGQLEFLDAWTPLTYERYCNAYHGSYMSFTVAPQKKAVRLKGAVKGVKNLQVAGQWTYTPGGLPVAVTSGKFAVQRILKRQKREINI